MDPEQIQKDTTTETIVPTDMPVVEVAPEAEGVATPAPVVGPTSAPVDQRDQRRNFRGGGDMKKNSRRPARRESKVKPEFDQKIIDIRRVARVVAGGRRFSFSVAIVAGNRKGSVGVGLGKANDTSIAIDKAVRAAKKDMITINLTDKGSIAHESEAKFSASRVLIMPAPGRGVVAGSAVRTVLELAGVKDVGAKIRSGSKNKVNNARAAIVALSRVSKPRHRGVKAAAAPTSAK